MARDLPNVHFEGLLGGRALARLFRSARAVVVPSLFPETFGYVVLEAFAVGTPVIVHEDGGALYETGLRAAAGWLPHRHRAADCACAAWSTIMACTTTWPPAGSPMRMGEWSETEHLDVISNSSTGPGQLERNRRFPARTFRPENSERDHR